jgi:hypothetical protein
MVTVERQVHGYRQGHQLLASSAQLPKADQSVIDRLSDVAGPLRPKEKFEPYLTAYPLPSGHQYVLARTWQDSTVARAGCVRTLSLIIPVETWASAKDLGEFLPLLEAEVLPAEPDATSRAIFSRGPTPLPPTPDFRASELLEALFLEETRPVAIFDAPLPELIAVRLLTALWSGLRRRFALSTFALSPRKVSGRDFDLVFAPKDARSKFADWPGRRVDGRSTQEARHKWTGQIVRRVFDDPFPRLLTDREIGLVGSSTDDTDYAAALRIALLWEELSSKLPSTPTAALGLLDIANSGLVRDSTALRELETEVSTAVRTASETFPIDQAWDFLGAIVRKIQDRPMPESKRAVAGFVQSLSGRAPAGAIALLTQPDLKGAVADLLPSIAQGLSDEFGPAAEEALLASAPTTIGRLIAQDNGLALRVANDRALVNHVVAVLPDLDPSLFEAVSRTLLPQLNFDWQAQLAKPLLGTLNPRELADQLGRLGRSAQFAERELTQLFVDQARATGGLREARSELSSLPPSEARDDVLATTLDVVPTDVAWLLDEAGLPSARSTDMLVTLLKRADARELSTILADAAVGSEVIGRLRKSAPELIHQAILTIKLPYEVLKICIRASLPAANAETRQRIAVHSLPLVLRSRSAGDELDLLRILIDACGPSLDGAWLVHAGLAAEISAGAASRNMVAFQTASPAARARIMGAVADIADALYNRRAVDLDGAAVRAYADLLSDAEKDFFGAVLKSAGRLLPSLMRQRSDPVSPVIVVMFAAIYRELAKEDDVPDLLKFVPFWDWDRCKAARQELVSAFMSSSWPPGDLALTACRCSDVSRILRRTAKSYGGDSYIERISGDLGGLPANCRKTVNKTISTLKADWSAKYDWRD